jgi:hypothetical protein
VRQGMKIGRERAAPFSLALERMDQVRIFPNATLGRINAAGR